MSLNLENSVLYLPSSYCMVGAYLFLISIIESGRQFNSLANAAWLRLSSTIIRISSHEMFVLCGLLPRMRNECISLCLCVHHSRLSMWLFDGLPSMWLQTSPGNGGLKCADKTARCAKICLQTFFSLYLKYLYPSLDVPKLTIRSFIYLFICLPLRVFQSRKCATRLIVPFSSTIKELFVSGMNLNIVLPTDDYGRHYSI